MAPSGSTNSPSRPGSPTTIMADELFHENSCPRVAPAPAPSNFARWLAENYLLLTTLGGVLLGVTTGFLLRPLGLSEDAIHLLSYPGEIFMRLLKLMILPLVIASIIAGTSRLNARMNGKVAVRTMLYFALTSLLNAALGVLLAMTIRPGDPGDPGETGETTKLYTNTSFNGSQVLDGVLDLGRNLFTDNLFQAAFQRIGTAINFGTLFRLPFSSPYVVKNYSWPKTLPESTVPSQPSDNIASTVYTVYVPLKKTPLVRRDKTSPPTSSQDDVPYVRSLEYRDGTNTLGLIFFCLLFGTVLGMQGPKAQLVIDFFVVVYEVIMKMVCGIMWITPLGVASVISGKILSVGNISLVMSQIGWFVLTVVVGVLFYQLVIMQMIYYVFLRKNPLRFYFGLSHPIITAFATASTAAALPLSLRCMDRLKIDPRVSRFVLPVGCAINMDGTALFISVATIFIAQMNVMPLGWGQLATVCLTSTAASMSSASVPSAALVLLAMVLSTIGAPEKDAYLLLAIDWFVDRFRTTNNLLGDCYAAAVVEHLSKRELSAFQGNPNNCCVSHDYASSNGHLVTSISLDDRESEPECNAGAAAVMETPLSLQNGQLKT